MKTGSVIGNRRGVSLVETLLAVVLISAVGVIVVQLLQKNNISMAWNRQTRKAAALTDMVMEKYDYLASVEFATLEQVNQTSSTVSAFFATGNNNQGYDGMTITTVADPTSPDGTRKLTVTIGWGAQGPNQTFTMTKYLVPGTGVTGGAPVHVYVLDQNGVGVQGFEVHAAHEYDPAYLNSIGTNEVIGFTDSNGYVVLNNVSVDPTLQPMSISAQKPGSDASIHRSDPSYVQGYYAPSDPHLTDTIKTLAVTQTSANNVTFDMRNGDFYPLGRIDGVVTGGPPSTQFSVNYTANETSSLYNNIQLGGASWIQTDNSGNYELNNVAPGPIQLIVQGINGTNPTIPPTNPSFVQGYVGASGNPVNPWQFSYTMPGPATSMDNTNLPLQTLGSLALTTTVSGGGLLPGATVSFTWPNIGDRGATPWTGKSNSQAQVNLYNLFAIPNQPIAYNASVSPTGCSNPGSYLNNYNANAYPVISNSVTLPLSPGATLSGTLVDSLSNPLGNMQVEMPGLDGTTLVTNSAADGTFSFCGISPTTNPSWPTVTFQLWDNSNKRVASTFSGTTVDNNYPTQTVPNANILPASNISNSYVHNLACASDPNPTNGTSDTITSDSGGNYGPICIYTPYFGTVSQAVTGGPVAYSAGIITVNNTTMQVGLEFKEPPYYKPKNSDVMVTNGTITPGFTLKSTLIEQTVTGTLLESGTGVALQGVAFDPCSICSSPAATTCPVTTNGSGGFGPVQVCVNSRTNSNAGKVTITVPGGVQASNTGHVYSGASQNVSIPTPATPTTALTVTISLNRSGGGI